MRALMFLLPAVLIGKARLLRRPEPSRRLRHPTPKLRSKVGCCAEGPASALETDEQKTVYALGLQMYRSLAQFDHLPKLSLSGGPSATLRRASRRWM
jgi:hypothetical protein